MPPIFISRVLLILFIINEIIVVICSKPGEIQSLTIPLITKLSLFFLLIPFFYVLPIPDWLGWVLVAIQAGGLLLEVASEIQLARAKSFGVASDAASNIQKRGIYRWLENPIYVGILVQVFTWALWMPLALIAAVLIVPVIRSMVASERQFIATQHNDQHRGIDSFIWN